MGSPAVDLTDVPPQLRELVEEANRAGEVVLTHEGEAVAKIIPWHKRKEPRRPGSARGTVVYMAEDFDATPDDFKEYL
jgi:antitoxin (DNA-binding transcriptional repressor) of toxin-antitoxin stability system